MPRIHVLASEGKRTHSIDANVARLGRHPDNDIIIRDRCVSRFHAVIKRVDDTTTYLITDAGSHNGIKVNARRVTEAILRHGDRIRFGTLEAVFEDPAAVPSLSKRRSQEKKAPARSRRAMGADRLTPRVTIARPAAEDEETNRIGARPAPGENPSGPRTVVAQPPASLPSPEFDANLSLEQRCGIKPGTPPEEIREHLALLYRRHNRAASSLNETTRAEAEIMLDAIVACREKYLG